MTDNIEQMARERSVASDEHLADTQDTKEKRNIGQLWAEKSGGKGLFLMAEKRDAQGRDTRAQILVLAGH